jgi:hypothetical protein
MTDSIVKKQLEKTAAEMLEANAQSTAVAIAGILPARKGYTLLRSYYGQEPSMHTPILGWAVMADTSVRPVASDGVWDLDLQQHMAVGQPDGSVVWNSSLYPSANEWFDALMEETGMHEAA